MARAPEPADHSLARHSWTGLRDALAGASGRAVALLPVGSTEPHGPHLPLLTDVLISEETARRAAQRLAAHGVTALVLPPIAYSVTDFSKGFAGAIGLTRATTQSLVEEVSRSCLAQGFAAVCLVNSHLEPEHLSALREAAARVSTEMGRPVVFPDKTQRRWAATLTEEFRSGACHAGRYETSLVLASRPELVDEASRAGLPPNPVSIGRKIKEGAKSFLEAGGNQAYFGDPAAASPEEGESSFEALAAMVETAVLEATA